MPLKPAVEGGDHLASLEALRDVLAGAIDRCDSDRDLVGLSARLMDALAQIAEIKAEQPAQEGTPLDDLRKRRQARQSGAAGRARAGGGVESG